jgi:hypothetical protein
VGPLGPPLSFTGTLKSIQGSCESRRRWIYRILATSAGKARQPPQVLPESAWRSGRTISLQPLGESSACATSPAASARLPALPASAARDSSFVTELPSHCPQRRLTVLGISRVPGMPGSSGEAYRPGATSMLKRRFQAARRVPCPCGSQARQISSSAIPTIIWAMRSPVFHPLKVPPAPKKASASVPDSSRTSEHFPRARPRPPSPCRAGLPQDAAAEIRNS